MKPCGSAYAGGLLCYVYSGEDNSPELAQYRNSGRPFQTAVQWVLRSPIISTTVPAVHSIQEIDELVMAAKQDWWPYNDQIIEAYRRRFRELHSDARWLAWNTDLLPEEIGIEWTFQMLNSPRAISIV